MSNLQVSTLLNNLSGQTDNRISQINVAADGLYRTEIDTTKVLGGSAGVVIGVIMTKNYLNHMNSAIRDVAKTQRSALDTLIKKGGEVLDTEKLKDLRTKINNELKTLDNEKAGLRAKTKSARQLAKLNTQLKNALAEVEGKIGTVADPATKVALENALKTGKGCVSLIEGRITNNLPKELAEQAKKFSKPSKYVKAVLEMAESKVSDGRLQRAWNAIKGAGRRFGGPILVAGGAILVAAEIVQEDFDPNQKMQIEKLSKLMDTSTGDKAYNPVSLEERQRLIEWALAHTTDPAERAVLEGIKNNGYDVRKYLESTGQIKQHINIKEGDNKGPITKEWIQQNDDNITNGINAQFYGDLAKKANLKENQLETSPGDELATGDLQPIDSTPKSEKEVLEQEVADTTIRLQKWIQENKELKPLLQKYLNNEELTEEEKAKIKPFIDDYENLQMLQKKLNDLDGGKQAEGGLDNKEKPAPSTAKAGKAPATPKAIQGANLNPALLQPNAAQAALTRSGTQESLTPEEIKKKNEMANLPPEAIVQQPEEESFWTWKNILLILAAVGTLGIGAYFIIKYKKKADDAKKETSSLQSTVNDLQSQVNDLQGNTDSTNGTTPSIDEGLTKSASLASVATNITNTSLDSTNTILSGNDNTRV